MKIAKKSLSVFLSLLMIITSCSVGLFGITSFAAAGDSSYTHNQVVELINAAIANGYSSKSSGNATNLTGDDGTILAAAEAIYDYAVKTYREGKKSDSKYNSSDTLLAKFAEDFAADFPVAADANAAYALATDVLNPNGTTLYGYPNTVAGSTETKDSSSWTLVNIGVDPARAAGDNSNADWIQSYYNPAVKEVTKTVSVKVDVEKFLLSYNSIEDIPSSFLTSVSYTYAHAIGKYAYTTNTEVSLNNWGKKCYRSVTTTSSWNYMSGRPVRVVTKDKTTKKSLLTYEKYFDVDRLATTREAMLQMSLADLQEEYTLATGYFDAIQEDFSKKIIDHFGMNYDGIVEYVNNLEFAYRVVAGMDAIDNLNAYIGSEYNEESYAEMSGLYTKVQSAYDMVDSLPDAVIDYICNEYDYTDEYESVDMDAAKAYIDELYAIMTEQRLEELVASMVATYTEYYSQLNKEDLETPTDAEIIGLMQKVEGYNEVLATYTTKPYYRTYWPTDYENAWNDFQTKLNEVAEVRDIKDDFETYYDYFMPLLYTTMIVDLDDDEAMDLYESVAENLTALEESYAEVSEKWGKTIADKIWTIEYEGTSGLLQNIVKTSQTAGLDAVKANLIDRAEADLDAVEVYKDITEVNFENFAAIKSTLSAFNYDLYDYVTGGNRTGENWLSADYQAKYSQVEALLAKYRAFSTSDGESSFDKNFTFADENGNYAIRYAGDQTVEVAGEDEDGNPTTAYEQIGYPNDIARGGAEDNYYVDEAVLQQTVVKLDSFIASRDFGALLGLVDSDTEEATDLKTFVNQMLNESVFTSDFLNSLIAMIYPMLCDLIETEIPKALEDLGTPNDPGASGAIDTEDAIGLEGLLNIYLDDDEKTIDDNWNGRNQRYYYELFEDAELYIYPRSFAKFLNISNPAVFKAGNELYDQLIKADRSWSYFELQQDLLDEEGNLVAEEGTMYIGYDWNINGDRDAFLDALSYIFDSIIPLVQVLMLGTTYTEDLVNAAYVWGKVKTLWWENQLGGWGTLHLTINCFDAEGNNYPVWQSVIVPLMQALGVTNVPTLKADFSGEDLVNALLGTLFDRVDEILASPLDSILSILPNLVYFISMDSVQEILDNINLSINLGIGVEINSDDSGAIGDIAGAVGNLFDFLDNITSFDLSVKVSDELDLYDMLGFEISDFNAILQFALGSLLEGVTLPELKQQEIIFCSEFTRRADGSVNLVANKGDLLYWFIDFVVKALIPDENGNSLITSLLGDDMDPTLKSIIDRVVSQLTGNPKGALAAIIELLNPVEYDLEAMDWVESTWNYDEIEGANQMSIVYLNYGNDWTQDDAEYLVDNIDSIVASILDMVDVDIDDLGAYLQDMVNGLFTNDNITAIVEMLGGLGDSPSAVITDIVTNQLGLDLESWFVAYGYLFPEGTWKEDAEIIKPTSQFYVNNFGVEGVANEDGTITWSFNKMPLVDGDGYTFVNILSRLIGGASLLVEFLFGGEDIAVFNDVLTIKGYETYDTSLGLLLTMLGVKNLPTQEDFTNDAMGSLTNTLTAVLDWFYALTDSEDMIAQVLELIPDVFYFIESNGLSTLLHNLLMPILVVVDTVRPLLDVDINGLLSVIVSEFLNYGTLDFDVVLEYLVHGIYMKDDFDFVYYAVDINNLTLTDLMPLVDTYLGTNLATSGLVEIGIKGLCSGVVPVTGTSVGDIYRTTVTAADSITIIITAIIDCLSYPAKDATKANGDVICEFIAEMTDNESIAGLYPTIKSIIDGIEYEYDSPNWGYMFESADKFNPDELPEQTIVYLGYNTDWDKETADSVYDALDDILDLVLPSLLGEDETIATLVNGILEDNVYSDEILNTVVELIVNAIADFDATLLDLVDCVVATDITEWFTFCELDEETGEYVCTYDWGVDEAAEADKKDIFVAGIKEVLEPANSLLSWLFFGTDYAFFTSSEVDEDGNYTYADLITLNGGEGYAYGLVPIFEALGCTMQPAENFYDEETNTYKVGDAIESILNAALTLVDEISANPVEEVFNLLPNLIYFINADGAKVCVNNLLAPVDAILEKLTPVVGEISIGGLLTDAIGFDICNIDMETLLTIATDNGVVITDEMIYMLANLYVGKLAEFTSANGNKAYRLDVTGYEGDVLTLIISFALDLFVINEDLFAPLLGEETYGAIVDLFEITESKAMQPYVWLNEKYADTDKVFNATETSVRYSSAYNNIWTRDKAEYIADNLVPFVSDILGLIGLEINGVKIKDVDDLLDSLLEGNLYTQATADSLLNVLKSLPDLFGEYSDLGDEAITILDNALGTSIGSWENMTVTVKNGDRDSFVAALETMLAPIVPLLDVLLCDEDLSFFYSAVNDEDPIVITIPGSEGYAYGIIPLFEALGCTMMDPETFKALDDEAKIGAILNPLLNRVDVILQDPVNEIFAMLPELIYFINSNGLDTSVNNILNSVDTVLGALEPILGEGKGSLMSLLGINLAEYNMDYIVKLACDAIEDSTGLDVEPLIVDFVAELTMGKVISYESANGETYCKMVYAGESQFADMITVLLRLAIDWLATGNNADAVVALIAGNSESEEAADSANTLIKFVLTAANTEPITSGAMATLYYIFYGINNGVAGIDYLYGNYGKSWNALVGFFEETDESYLDKAAEILKAILNEFAGVDTDSSVDYCDCNCHNNSGFIRFFFNLMNFFRRIFGMNQYRYCDCGAAHW